MSDKDKALETIIDRAYRSIEWNPQYLLETDAPEEMDGMVADVVVARLYGLDQELLDEMYLLKAEMTLYVPAYLPVFAHWTASDEEVVEASYRQVRFRLQSGYARTNVYDPVRFERGEFSVLCLRYKREPL